MCICSSAPSSAGVQLSVQRSELLQEAGVGADVAAGTDSSDGIGQGQVLVDHQVGQHQGGRATLAHHAVHQHLS